MDHESASSGFHRHSRLPRGAHAWSARLGTGTFNAPGHDARRSGLCCQRSDPRSRLRPRPLGSHDGVAGVWATPSSGPSGCRGTSGNTQRRWPACRAQRASGCDRGRGLVSRIRLRPPGSLMWRWTEPCRSSMRVLRIRHRTVFCAISPATWPSHQHPHSWQRGDWPFQQLPAHRWRDGSHSGGLLRQWRLSRRGAAVDRRSYRLLSRAVAQRNGPSIRATPSASCCATSGRS